VTADCFVRDLAVTTVALVDEHSRPVALLSREAFLGGDPPRPVSMRVSPVSNPAEVVRRAIARPGGQHFDPVGVLRRARTTARRNPARASDRDPRPLTAQTVRMFPRT